MSMGMEARHEQDATPDCLAGFSERHAGVVGTADDSGYVRRRTGLESLTVRQAKVSDDLPLGETAGDAGPAGQRANELGESCTAAGHLAEFRLALTSLCRRHAAATKSLEAASAAKAQKAWTALAASLSPGQRLSILHVGSGVDATVQPYQVLIRGQGFARHAAEACRYARQLHAELQVVLELVAPELGWREIEPAVSTCPSQWPAIGLLQPAALTVASGISAPDRRKSEVHQPSIRLPLPAASAAAALSAGAHALSRCRTAAAIQIDLMPTQLTGAVYEEVRGLTSRLLDLSLNKIREVGAAGIDQPVTAQAVQTVDSALRDWLRDPVGLRMRVLVRSKGAAMPPGAVLRMVGEELWQGRSFAVIATGDSELQSQCDPLNLSGLILPSLPWPPVLPDASVLREQGLPPHDATRTSNLPDVGVVIGRVPGAIRDISVRLHESAWSRHCHILGGTGTGKSRLMQTMVRDRLQQPHALILLDPHGPLFKAAHDDCPRWRDEQVVSLDFGDFDHAPSLNMLECSGEHTEMQRTFLIQALCETFLQMYPENKEAFGPMFFSYLTNAARLVMSDSQIKATVLDIPRVFSEPQFRQALIQRSKEPEVRAFWRGIALRAGGEASLENIAPYIVSKFNDLQQPPMRAFLGQTETTIDIRGIMDRGGVALINLAKGRLGERQARFLGLLLTSRILAALLSRSDMPSCERPEVHLVVDEFGSMMTPAFEGLLSEGRKYGLRAVLAHQHMAQIPPSLAQSVLANTGGMRVLLRLGADDALTMSRWVEPEFDAQALMTLPDRHAVVRMQVPNGVTAPFLMHTLEYADHPPAETDRAHFEILRERSRVRYCRPTADVNRDVDRRRVESVPAP